MQFLQIMQAPVVIGLPEFVDPLPPAPARTLIIPKFTIDDFVEWGSELEAALIQRVTENLDDTRRREYLSLYPPAQPDIQEFHRHARTIPGMQRIARTCLRRAKVKQSDTQAELPKLTEVEIDLVIKSVGLGRLQAFSFTLADMIDTSQVVPPKQGEQRERSGQDPLTSTVSPSSKGSSGTGLTTSPSSGLPTEEVPAHAL